MKKIVGVGNTLYIYSILISLIIMFGGSYSKVLEGLFQNYILKFYPKVILIYSFILLVLNVFYCVSSWKTKESNVDIYFVNKMIQIPAYILIFLFGLLFFISFLGMPMAIILFFVDLYSIILTGIFSLPTFNYMKNQHIISKNLQIIYSILSFGFCIDVIIAIIAYHQKNLFYKNKLLCNKKN